jgi:hypothetical protein
MEGAVSIGSVAMKAVEDPERKDVHGADAHHTGRATIRPRRRALAGRDHARCAAPMLTIVITPRNSGYFVMFPDGDISWQPSKKFAEQAAKVWFRRHSTIGTIEWRNGDG